MLFGALQAVDSVRAEARSIEYKVHWRRWLSGKTGQTPVCVYSEWAQDVGRVNHDDLGDMWKIWGFLGRPRRATDLFRAGNERIISKF